MRQWPSSGTPATPRHRDPGDLGERPLALSLACGGDLACVSQRAPAETAAFAGRLNTILRALRAAAPSADIAVLAPSHAFPPPTPEIDALYDGLNSSIAAVASTTRTRIADSRPVLNPVDPAARAAAICLYTLSCVTNGADSHPSDDGYQAIATAFTTVLRQRRQDGGPRSQPGQRLVVRDVLDRVVLPGAASSRGLDLSSRSTLNGMVRHPHAEQLTSQVAERDGRPDGRAVRETGSEPGHRHRSRRRSARGARRPGGSRSDGLVVDRCGVPTVTEQDPWIEGRSRSRTVRSTSPCARVTRPTQKSTAHPPKSQWSMPRSRNSCATLAIASSCSPADELMPQRIPGRVGRW